MSERNPPKRAAEKATDALRGDRAGPAQGILGKPAVRAPSAAEPTEPREPLPPKPDQTGPETVSPTGQPTGADQARRAQSGSRLTSAQGTRLYDTDHSLDGGMVPLVVAPTGGTLGHGPDAPAVQRTYATARSVEFDALLVAGAPGIGVDAYGARDAKAGLPVGGNGTPDPRVGLLLAEAYRHGKASGAAKGGEIALEAAGIPSGAPGVIAGDGATTVLQQLTRLLGSHRVWDRFPSTA